MFSLPMLEPDAGYRADDAVLENPGKKRDVVEINDKNQVDSGIPLIPELHEEHIQPYSRELPGTLSSRRSELP